MSKQRKLLLADDSVTIQKVVNLTFADEGIEVVAVGDGDAAMEKFVEFAPDLMLVDVNMPGMDGYRICEMIKQDAETAHIPVILLVGSFEPFDEEEAHRVGADGYLTKPFQSIRQLVGKVTSLLDSAAVPNAAVGKTGFDAETISGAGEESIAESAQTFQNIDSDVYAESNLNADNEVGLNVDAAPQFDDSVTNDDTIQTNQIGSLPADEAQRFSADFSVEDDSQISTGKPFENSFKYETEAEDNRAETQPLTAEESNEIQIVSDEQETQPSAEDAYESASERNFSNENAVVEKSDDKNIASPQPQNFSWDFDEMNLLELSSGDDKMSNAQEPGNEKEIKEGETIAQESVAAPQTNISPELIEQIAARVAEKLSARVVGVITRDFSPEIADLIAKEFAQEDSEK